MPTTRDDLLSAITPSEAAVLFSDRLVVSKPRPTLGRYTVPASGRGVDALDVVPASMQTLILTILASGATHRIEETRAWFFWSTLRMHLRLTAATPRWPEGSPEARLSAWFDQQPDRAGWVHEGIIAVFIPKRSAGIYAIAYRELFRGLVERGYVEPCRESASRLIRRDNFAITAPHRDALLGAGPAFERTHLTVRDRAASDVVAASRAAWGRAWLDQELDT